MKRNPVRMTPRASHAAVLLLASLILTAGSPQPEPLYGQDGTRISGAAISKVGRDTRKLTLSAQAGASSTSASGTMQFIHNSPAGLSRFRGTVTCLSVTGPTIQVSGVIEKGKQPRVPCLTAKATHSLSIRGVLARPSHSPTLAMQLDHALAGGRRLSRLPKTDSSFINRFRP